MPEPGRVFLFIAALVGIALIVAFERYRIPLGTGYWPSPGVGTRIKLFFSLAALLCTPLLAFAAYLRSLGRKVLRAQEFPAGTSRLSR